MVEKITKAAAKKPLPDTLKDEGESIVVTRRAIIGSPSETDVINAAPKVKLMPLNQDTKVDADSEAGEQPTEDSPDDSLAPNLDAESSELAAAKADLKTQEQVDALIESRAYVLPIDAAGKRESRLIAVMGTALILALTILLLDLMLDAGFIRIPGVSPVTHFFSV